MVRHVLSQRDGPSIPYESLIASRGYPIDLSAQGADLDSLPETGQNFPGTLYAVSFY